MTDLGLTIAPKSDQLNADDLISGPLTIKITKVAANPDSAEQPISIYFEGDGGKPYKACKSMRRVLVNVWGRDGNQFAGRSMTLYRDDKVQFGGLAVGGIRISHMSHIDKDVTMALTATRASRKPFTVKPLKVEPPASAESTKPKPTVPTWLAEKSALFDAAQTAAEVDAIEADPELQRALEKLQGAWLDQLKAMIAAARTRVTPQENVE